MIITDRCPVGSLKTGFGAEVEDTQDLAGPAKAVSYRNSGSKPNPEVVTGNATNTIAISRKASPYYAPRNATSGVVRRLDKLRTTTIDACR